MKSYINTSNYYLGVLTSIIDNVSDTGTFEVDSVENEHVTLPEQGFYWLDVDFSTSGEREIFRITGRVGNTLTYDKRISPTGKFKHEEGAVVGLRDFAQLFNMLSSNSDNFGQVEQISNTQIKIYGGNVFVQGGQNRTILTKTLTITPNNLTQYLHFDSTADAGSEYVLKNNQDPYLYLLASITTDTSSITGINDMRGIFIGTDLNFLNIDGSTPMEGDLDMNGHSILNANINPTVPSATGNTIAGFDGTSKLISLNPDTYPNFTELSYLKGATSNIQTQLDSKGDMNYSDYNFADYSGNSGYVINDLSMNIYCDSDIVLNAGTDLKEGQQYIVRITTDGLSHLVVFHNGISGEFGHLELMPNKTTVITLLATSSSTLEWQAQLGGQVTSINGQTGDVNLDLSSVLEDSGESGVGDLVNDTYLYNLAPGTYQVGAHEVYGQPHTVRLYYSQNGYFEARYGCTVSIQYNNDINLGQLGNYYTILSGRFIHYGFAHRSNGTYRKVLLHQNDPVVLPYAANIDVDLNQSLNFTLTLTGDCNLTFGQQAGHSTFTPGCVYQILIIQDSIGGHRINLPAGFLKAAGYSQDTTAGGISKLILDCQGGNYFASISRYL